MSGPYPVSKSEQDYRAEDDHRTLSRAAEIKSDKSRMAGVKRHHARVKKQLSSLGRSLRSHR